MAGFYPDVPAHRFAYHLDGTKILLLNSGTNVLTDVTTQAAALNNESTDMVSIEGNTSIIFMFPELRNLQAYFISKYNSNGNNYAMNGMYVSSDTTDGLDGTWTVVVNPAAWTLNALIPAFRNSIDAGSASNIKAVKFDYDSGVGTDGFYAIHLYGNIPLTESPDRLIFWDAVSDAQLGAAYFDWGDDVQGQTYTKQFRIKNNSATKTAGSITLSSGTPTGDMIVNFSTDGSTYTSSINIGDLAAGSTSAVLYAQRAVPSDEALSTRVCYLSAVASTWT